MNIAIKDKKFVNRFWSKINKTKSCWIWLGNKNKQGYGDIQWSKDGIKKHIRAHRLSYTLLKGVIPNNLQIDHLCKNTTCVNPEHLEIVTSRENTLRGSGITAKCARKKVCLLGHPFDNKNTIFRKNKKGEMVWRTCKKCEIARHKKSWIKKRNNIEKEIKEIKSLL